MFQSPNCTNEIIRLAPSQVPQAADMLTQAFLHDPMYIAICSDEYTRARPMNTMWQALMKYHLLFGEVYTTRNINGIAAWLPPGKTTYTLWRMLRSGFALVRAMGQFPADARKRAMGMMSDLEEIHKRMMPRPHWYLSVLGVVPTCQGKGIGSALLKPVLEKADATGMPCYLEAMVDKNVAFYQKRGFEIVHQGGAKGLAVMAWGMARETRNA